MVHLGGGNTNTRPALRLLLTPLLLLVLVSASSVSPGQHYPHSGDTEMDFANLILRQLDENATNENVTTTEVEVTTTSEVEATTTSEVEVTTTEVEATTTEVEVTTTEETTTLADNATLATTSSAETTAAVTPAVTSTDAPATTTTAGAAATTTADPAVGVGSGGNESAATTTTPAAQNKAVKVRMTISGVSYAALSTNEPVRTEFIAAIETGIVEQANQRMSNLQLSQNDISTELQPASARRLQVQLQGLRRLQSSTGVLAESVITLPAASSTPSNLLTLASTLDTASSSVETAVEAKIKAVANVASVTVAGATIAVSGAAASVVTTMATTTTVYRPNDIATAGAIRHASTAAAALATLLAVLLF